MSRLGALLKSRFLRFRREIVVVSYAIRHPGTPLRLKLAGTALILYLASPIDLIPLVVPVVGLVDDLILVPWGLGAVVRRLPADVRADADDRAARFIGRYVRRPLVFLAVLVLTLVLVWAVLLALLWWGLAGWFAG